MTEFLSKDSANRMQIYHLHKSFGVVVLILFFFRFVNRFKNPSPHLPQTIAKRERTLAHLGHIVLYVFMLAVPLSGYLMSNSFGYPVHLFSIEMPFLVQKNIELGKFFSGVHKYAAYGLIALLVLHIAGVVKHRFFDKPENDVLKRMI